ncbi:MAG: hypothetical protein R3Y07_03050 [Eubacteriales bacterium]
MDISNNYLWSVANNYSSSSADTSTTMDSSAFTDMLTSVQSQNSYIQEMNRYGVQEMGQAPDFSSMTTDEFLAHLIEVQESLAASGVDISDMTDPTTLTMEELEALQTEMQQKPPPPPPPSMEMMNFNFVDYSSLTADAFESLFSYM